MSVSKFILKVVYPYRLYLLGPIFVMLFNSLETSLRSYLIKLIIDAASYKVNEAVQKMWVLAPYFIGLQFLSPLAWRLQDWCAIKYEPDLKKHIIQIVFKYITLHDYRYFQNQLAGSIASKINDLTNIPSLIHTLFFHFFANILSLIIAAVMLWQVNVWFTIAIIIWAIFIICISLATVQKFNFLTRNSSEAYSKSIGNLIDSISNMLNIQLFANRKEESLRLSDIQNEYVNASKKRRWFILNSYSIQGLSFAIYQACSLVLLIYLYSQGKVTPGDFALTLTINSWILECLWQLSDKLRELGEVWGMIEQALKTLYVPQEVQDKPNAKPLKIAQGEIIFNAVKFHYKGNTPLFHDLNIKILSGQKIGLVGYSGGGKTTFAHLILRIFDINSGRILIDDQNIRDIKQSSLRANIAFIPQDPSLFHRPVMDNIRFGRVNATDEEVIEAAKRAHAHDFITNLPEGYKSLVGERGVKLSGGQRQRIAIARAILKNAPIIILDEATSQLDSVTERYIQESLWQLMQGKTTIVIAHRLSTLLHMDRILVFDKGQIIEDGTHEELIAKNGRYKTLWDTQVSGFLSDKGE